MTLQQSFAMMLVLLALAGAGGIETGHAAERNLLYVARAPKDRSGFRTLRASLEVHDINDRHRLVKVIPLNAPAGAERTRDLGRRPGARRRGHGEA